MVNLSLNEIIINILKEFGPLTVKEINEKLITKKIFVPKERINSILYGDLHERVNRDLNERGIPVWSNKGLTFHASTGLENKLYRKLVENKIISTSNSEMDYLVENKRRGKVYHLDIAVDISGQKFNIEVDGFDHLRADARLSILKQIRSKGEKVNMEIDWMDNNKSYVNFKEIDNSLVFKWCIRNLDWCRKYHEELIWPDDINRNIFLLENGWKIMRLWNEEVKRDIDRSVREIEEWLYR